ncbi:hypothetical protein DAETH_07320 [Deinococcus aetherius]|uniref:Uncharacterized protein n=1 Tax=Deinococcus aetherius TaxID=200252 RepID=A0ABN6RFF5_9DEIO|nr:hypothetical protein DAETH_07320 [Deinococcus aetherius]
MDSRVPDPHEQRVFAQAYCAARPGSTCTPRTVGSLVFYDRLVSTLVVYGSFAKANAREALVTQCAAESDRCEGVTLFRRLGNRWNVVHRTPGITPRECLKLRGVDGRDVLACRGNTIFLPGPGLSLDFVAVGGKRTYRKPLLPTRNLNCQKTQDAVNFAWLGDWSRRDVDGDGRADLTVQLRQYRLTFADEEGCLARDARSVQEKTTSLTWFMRGDTLVPDGSARRAVHELKEVSGLNSTLAA